MQIAEESRYTHRSQGSRAQVKIIAMEYVIDSGQATFRLNTLNNNFKKCGKMVKQCL